MHSDSVVDLLMSTTRVACAEGVDVQVTIGPDVDVGVVSKVLQKMLLPHEVSNQWTQSIERTYVHRGQVVHTTSTPHRGLPHEMEVTHCTSNTRHPGTMLKVTSLRDVLVHIGFVPDVVTAPPDQVDAVHRTTVYHTTSVARGPWTLAVQLSWVADTTANAMKRLIHGMAPTVQVLLYCKTNPGNDARTLAEQCIANVCEVLGVPPEALLR